MNINPWSQQYIRKLADEATYLAKMTDLRPALATEVIRNFQRSSRLNIPFLGDYVSAGWRRIDHLIEPVFVDTTGRGRPILTSSITPLDFFKLAEQHTQGESSFVVGYGVIERGQMQVLVAAYRKEV